MRHKIILLADDDPKDEELTRCALKRSNIRGPSSPVMEPKPSTLSSQIAPTRDATFLSGPYSKVC
jgi:hypothetical protein